MAARKAKQKKASPAASAPEKPARRKTRQERAVSRLTVRELPFITTTDLAEALGVHKETVMRYIRAGVIKVIRNASPKGQGRFKIPRDWAIKYINGEVGHVPLARPKGGAREVAPNPRQLSLY